MNYSAINKCDIANGPGVRVSLFVSGCSRRCKGCFNEAAWDFTYGQEFTYETASEIDRLLDNPNIAGLSILGGDPFEPENRDSVESLCEYVRTFFPEKTIWVWTGYLWEDVRYLPIMHNIDVLVDGPFISELKDLRLQWRGSSNQRVIDVRESLKRNCAIRWRGLEK